jgi:hypothetical protein
LLAGAEDRATLESDLSADVGAYTDGQGDLLCPLICPSGMRESDKLKLLILKRVDLRAAVTATIRHIHASLFDW